MSGDTHRGWLVPSVIVHGFAGCLRKLAIRSLRTTVSLSTPITLPPFHHSRDSFCPSSELMTCLYSRSNWYPLYRCRTPSMLPATKDSKHRIPVVNSVSLAAIHLGRQSQWRAHRISQYPQRAVGCLRQSTTFAKHPHRSGRQPGSKSVSCPQIIFDLIRRLPIHPLLAVFGVVVFHMVPARFSPNRHRRGVYSQATLGGPRLDIRSILRCEGHVDRI